MFDLFKTFFLLGWVSFGGPAAHIGYFRTAFVEKRQWLTESEYAQLIALSQFLPGPGSSQIGFSIGYQRGGLVGGIVAFLGFTTPSILLMMVVASLSSTFIQTPIWQSIVYGLKLLAVIVVADATINMFRQFCHSKVTICLFAMTACATLVAPSVTTQILCLILAALLGRLYLTSESTQGNKQTLPSHQHGISNSQRISAILFVVFFFLLPWFNLPFSFIQLFSEFFQAGSLVFGGGHVVLPLLQNTVAEQINSDQFLTGYSIAQAVPGPMFTIATYLGYFLLPGHPIWGAIIATLGIFLPGFLLVIIFYRHWTALAQRSSFSGMISGVNAAVVGLLLSALYYPVFTSAVSLPIDMIWVIAGLVLLRAFKLPIILLVATSLLFGITFYSG